MSKNIALAKEQLKELIETRNGYRKMAKKTTDDLEEAKREGRDGFVLEFQKDLDKFNGLINDIQEQIKAYEDSIEEASEEGLNKAGDIIKKFGKEYSLRWIADMARFISLKNEHGDKEKKNLVYKQTKTSEIIGILNVWSNKPGCFDNFTWQQVRYMCEKNKLAFESLQVSFNKDKWSGGHSFNLMNEMREHWVKIDPRVLNMSIAPDDEELQYDSLLDDWLYTLNGGKDENIWHTKEFVIQKLLYPEQFTDSGSLNPYYTGTPGGNGKGILVIILATLFTPMSIVMSRAKEMADSFNSRQQGKIFNIIDEGDEGHISQAALKKRSGSEEIVIEGKGLEPVTMDRTESMIIFDNSGNTVELKGPGEDRRWSIIETNLVMIDYFVKKLNISREEAAEICAFIADLAKDRKMVTRMVNKWMYDLIQRHNDFYVKHKRLPKLVALHGQDYQNRLDSKQDSMTELFEQLHPVIEKHGFIPFKWLKDIAETKNHNISDREISDKFDEFMKRKGHAEIKRTNGRVRVFCKGVDTGQELNGSIRRIKTGPNEFEFANLCSSRYEKGIRITEDTMNINVDKTWKKQTQLELQRELLQQEAQKQTNNYRNIGL